MWKENRDTFEKLLENAEILSICRRSCHLLKAQIIHGESKKKNNNNEGGNKR